MEEERGVDLGEKVAKKYSNNKGSKLIKKKHLKVAGLVLAVLAAVGMGAYYYFGNKNSATKTTSGNNSNGNSAKVEEAKYYPIYVLNQSNKSRVIIFDPEKKKHLELFSIDYPDGTMPMSADYSDVKKAVAYNDDKGIVLYDLASKQHVRLIENKVNTNSQSAGDMPYTERYFAPKWSPDGKTILVRIGYYEGSSYALLDPSTKTLQKIQSDGNYDFIWSADSQSYAIASEAGMDSAQGLYTNQADSLLKTKQVLPSNLVADAGYSGWSADGKKIYFSIYPNKKDEKGNVVGRMEAKLAVIDKDGQNYSIIEEDANNNVSSVIDGETIYFSKIDSSGFKGLGIYKISTVAGSKAEKLYQDADKTIYPVAINGDNLFAYSINNLKSDYLKTIYLVSKSTGQATSLGEAKNIGFVNWINSKDIPSDLAKVETPKPTEAEQKAYEDSLKTHGYLSKTYYDYCWEYNCDSTIFPYSKKDSAIAPEIISLSQKPAKLSGNVSVPLIFINPSYAFSDSQLNIYEDASKANSPANIIKWVNDQATANGQNLHLTLDAKREQFAFPTDCVATQNNVKKLSTSCFRNKVLEKYPTLNASPVWFVVDVYDSDLGTGGLPDVDTVEGNKLMFAYDSYSKSFTPTDNHITLDMKTQFGNYFIQNFMENFGAKMKLPRYKMPASGSTTYCYFDPKEDIMCGEYLDSSNQSGYSHLELSNLVIGSVTKKELGWYDADGDGINEVDDSCPFDKNNTCAK